MGFFDQFFSGGNSDGGGNPSGANNPYKDQYGGTSGKQHEGRMGGTGGDMGSLMRNLKEKMGNMKDAGGGGGSYDPGVPNTSRGSGGQVTSSGGNFITQLISMLSRRR
jgi:hypothetical protein